MRTGAREWTLSIETFGGATDSADALERFADRLEQSGIARGPAASLNTREGVLSATFQVEASTEAQAADRAVNAFADALAAADVHAEALRIEIAPFVAEEEPVPA